MGDGAAPSAGARTQLAVVDGRGRAVCPIGWQMALLCVPNGGSIPPISELRREERRRVSTRWYVVCCSWTGDEGYKEGRGDRGRVSLAEIDPRRWRAATTRAFISGGDARCLRSDRAATTFPLGVGPRDAAAGLLPRREGNNDSALRAFQTDYEVIPGAAARDVGSVSRHAGARAGA
jgi:hypothetical protein